VAVVIRRFLRGSEWRREVLLTNLWVVPAIEVVAAAALFAITYALDLAAYEGKFALPGWTISGSPDAARQILTAIAAAIITVVGVVFSIVIVALTLTSTQFGPRMLLEPERDNRVLGSADLVEPLHGTVVQAPTELRAAHQHHGHAGADGGGPRGADLLPQSRRHPDPAAAGHRGDRGRPGRGHRRAGGRRASPGADDRQAARVISQMAGPGGAVNAAQRYLQFIHHRTLVRSPEVGAVVHLRYRPGHFLVQGHPYATVCRRGRRAKWPGNCPARTSSGRTGPGPGRLFGIDQLVEIGIRALSSAVNDTFTALTCIDWIGTACAK
jgi:uncharacterized membrane protein